MKYHSCDMLQDFEFHDSEWKLASFQSNALVVNAKLLNIHRDAVQNTNDCDMEIKCAQITFSECNILSFYQTEPTITYTDQAAADRFLHELYSLTTVYAFSKVNDDAWELIGSGDEPYFEARFTFDSVSIEWDEYRRPAWYVLKERGFNA